ncbi:unnamed protein product [Mytilus coruscus]|uniref:ORC1/DEAH AAA+ ATPase domain-containing protein n=1 Tax=Mytilus coruscus TaxID=42192 RepID=A0A6J8BYE6_MYTCO|nr:unnamed protein product [Mytilus coruscus]
MATNSSSEKPSVGGEKSTLSPVDVAIHELKEHLLVDEEFCQEWIKNNPFYNDGDDVICSINAMRARTTEEDVLQALILTTESLNLHIDSGTTNVADKFKKYKQTLQNCLAELKCEKEYEIKHFVGRVKDIESVMKVFSSDLRDCSNNKYIGVCLCGMGGNGKTTLAEHIGLKLQKRKWSFKKIDFRELTSLLQFIRQILIEFGHTCFDENVDRIKSKLFSVLEDQGEIKQDTLLLLDNIDDIHRDWDDLLKFLEQVMILLNNNTENKIKLLITSRKKLMSEKEIGVYETITNFFKSSPTELDRFDGLCLERELETLGYDDCSKLVSSLLPREIQKQITSSHLQKLMASCGFNPLLIHTICDTLRNNEGSLPDMLGNMRSCVMPLTDRLKSDSCIEQTFLQMKHEHQIILVQLHVFKTCRFNMKAVKTITGALDTLSLQIRIMHLKAHHLIEIHTVGSTYSSEETSFSLHPMVSHFLKEASKKAEMTSIFKEAVREFMKWMQDKIEQYENTLEIDYKKAQYIFVQNEAHFLNFCKYLKKDPSNGSRTIKQNKQISEVADLILNDKKKAELIESLRKRSEKDTDKLSACFWWLENAELDLDMDNKEVINTVNDQAKILKSISSKHTVGELIPVIAILMFLKGRIYYRFDEFDDGYKAVYTAIYILTDVEIEGIKWVVKPFKTLRSKVFNLLGCLLLREKRIMEAFHCFIKAFALMTKKTYKARSQNMALFISNIGACFFQCGRKMLNDKLEFAQQQFLEAMKFSQKAIRLRQTMGHEKFSTYAFELQKRGKVYLEFKDFNSALADFKTALGIHMDIETMPHSNITLALHLIGKTCLLQGQYQVNNGLQGVGKEHLEFSRVLYDSIADLIYDCGLTGYNEEYEEIKSNHIWLLNDLNVPAESVSKFKGLYKECESGKRESAWKKNSRREVKFQKRYKNVLELLGEDKLLQVLDDQTKTAVKQWVTNAKQSEPLTDEEFDDVLPIVLNNISDETINDENDETFFQELISIAHKQYHKDCIHGVISSLKEMYHSSDDMELVTYCINHCKQEKQTGTVPRIL